MAGYKDRTFCKAWHRCFFGKGCPNAATPKTLDTAERLGYAISVTERRPCFLEKGKETLSDIVLKFLLDNRFEGLYSESGSCACGTDDLMPCNQPGKDCRPGYKAPCDCGEGCDFHITPKKKEF